MLYETFKICIQTKVFFLQITDLIMGAIGYHLRGEMKVIAKKNLINRIQKHSHYGLDRSTPKAEDKLNLFFIELQ